jgi:hypothetical protein
MPGHVVVVAAILRGQHGTRTTTNDDTEMTGEMPGGSTRRREDVDETPGDNTATTTITTTITTITTITTTMSGGSHGR